MTDTTSTSTRSETAGRPDLIRFVRRGALFLGALAASVAIAGCGDDSAADTAPAAAPGLSDTGGVSAVTPDAQHNAADVGFAEQVIPYERQAIAVGTLTGNGSDLPAVKALGGQIATEWQHRGGELTGFLSAWNATAPDTDSPAGSVRGVDDSQDHQLRQSSGPAFDKQFLSTMIGADQGVVALARTELANGENPQAKTLAQHIVAAGRSELSAMRTILVGPDFGHF